MTRAHWIELGFVTLLAVGCAAAIPLQTGYFAWSWDALNHHVYLGMTAEHPRWHLDVLPASVQSYQYPYLYWPVYRLSLLSGSGAWLGAAWSAFQALMLIVPLWCICLRLLPTTGGVLMAAVPRLLACVLAFTNTLVLVSLETTANDSLAAVPLLWAVFVGLSSRPSLYQAFAAATLWGTSVAFKLSNGLFIPLLFFWWMQREAPFLRWRRGLMIAAGAFAGFTSFYAPWGAQLWRQTGNPFHPFLAQLFATA